MRYAIKTAIVAMTFFLAAPLWAQDFDAGYKAAQRGDYEAALREWRPLADQGDVRAQFTIGIMYAQGHGVTQDLSEAVNW